MVPIPDSEEPTSSSSLFCSCCRLGGSKKRKAEDVMITETKLYEPTMSLPINNAKYYRQSDEDIPDIILSTPGQSTIPLETGRSDIFTTARTSRPDEINKYDSMTNLVSKIRSEAGFVDTPRNDDGIEDVDLDNVTITQLKIEGLAELQNNNEAPLPSVSSEYYRSRTPSPEVCVEAQPTEQSIQEYKPSIHRRFGEVTYHVYTMFWKAYSLMITFVALFLEKLLPV